MNTPHETHGSVVNPPHGFFDVSVFISLSQYKKKHKIMAKSNDMLVKAFTYVSVYISTLSQ